ncbi:hypothetical protein Dcar01_01827 [Deinococcus carri]|uniref:Uncharacterized protein n=1 Tax=Deinococcus carri TaxID=1211323 RepID=A0ABP9W7J9_9DEIO
MHGERVMLQPPLSRAHRRILGLIAPVGIEGDYHPLRRLVFAPGCRAATYAHLETAGVARGGLLIGYTRTGTVHVHMILPAGYVGLLPAGDPLAVDASYVLGVVDAARLSSGEPLDWVGSWVMRADGRAVSETADYEVWRRARRRALVSSEVALVTVGQDPERLIARAYVEDEGAPMPLEVVWEHGWEGERAWGPG